MKKPFIYLQLLVATLTCTCLVLACSDEEPTKEKAPQELSGLVAKYSFNKGNANDDSGNEYNASEATVSFTTDRFNNNKHAAAFSGNQYISIPEYEAFDSENLTVSLWMKAGSAIVLTQRLIVLSSSAQSRQNFSLNYNVNSTFDVDFRYEPAVPDPGKAVFTNTAVNDGEWHHVVGVRNASAKTMTIFLDGIKQAETAYTVAPLTADHPLQIGRYNSTIMQYFTGSLDDIRIFNRPLTQLEIEELFNEPNPN
jgi:hypothetical protein